MYNMTSDLSSVGINLQLAAVNYHETMACKMDSPKIRKENPDMPPCVRNPPESEWQQLLASRAPGMPTFQDTKEKMIYDEFGGQHDDLFIYDRNGRLFAYLPSTRTAEVIGGPSVLLSTTQDVTTHAGYRSVRSLAILAAASHPARCGTSRAMACGSHEWPVVTHVAGLGGSMRLIHLMRRGRGRADVTTRGRCRCLLASPRLASLASYGGGARRITAPAGAIAWSVSQSVFAQLLPAEHRASALQDSTTRIHTKGHVACEQPYAKLRGITEHNRARAVHEFEHDEAVPRHSTGRPHTPRSV